MERQADVTVLISAARGGGPPEREKLFEAIYAELRRIAAGVPHVGRAGDTMQPTVLANELWLEFTRRFPDAPRAISENRATFFRSVALAMRTILRDHHRARVASKRGGGRLRVALDDPGDGAGAGDLPGSLEFLSLDAALDKLEQYNPRWYDVILQRFFAGRTIDQTAEILGVAPSTVIADWKLARGWLGRQLSETDDGAGGSDSGAA